VLRYVAQARSRGVGVVFITHNPHHAYVVGDRFIILKRGRVAGDWQHDAITRDVLISGMAGEEELDLLKQEIAQYNHIGM
jgi:simple sugar transport system ATP-binding protein